MNLKNTYMKPCPFCGSDVETYKDSEDFIHSTPSVRTRIYEINCLEIYGGCAASILGSSPEECIEKWNYRYEENTQDFGDCDTMRDENYPY